MSWENEGRFDRTRPSLTLPSLVENVLWSVYYLDSLRSKHQGGKNSFGQD
jgi:hypothetical protein